MKKLLRIMLVTGISLMSFSCYYDELQVAEIPPIEEDVSFAKDIQPIFNDNNCMQCHNASRNPDLRDGLAYASLVPAYATANDSEGSILLAKLVGGHRSVSTTNIALIKAWIDQGAQNN